MHPSQGGWHLKPLFGFQDMCVPLNPFLYFCNDDSDRLAIDVISGSNAAGRACQSPREWAPQFGSPEWKQLASGFGLRMAKVASPSKTTKLYKSWRRTARFVSSTLTIVGNQQKPTPWIPTAVQLVLLHYVPRTADTLPWCLTPRGAPRIGNGRMPWKRITPIRKVHHRGKECSIMHIFGLTKINKFINNIFSLINSWRGNK